MQKNKIDAVKAVCSSATKKLSVLSLAAAVSCGGVAVNAQIPNENNLTNTSALQVRLHALETKKSNMIQQIHERKRQRDERLLQAEENGQQEDLLAIFNDDITWEETFGFLYEMSELDGQINALRVQLGREPLRAPVENIFNFVRVNEEIDTTPNRPQCENQNETSIDMSTLTGEETNTTTTSQNTAYFGGAFNPFNWGFFGGSKK